MNKSLEALEILRECANGEKKVLFSTSLELANTIKQDLERLELIEALYNKSLKEVETIKNDDRELYLKFKQLEKENEKFKQQRDSLAINNGELCVKVADLQKENQELKHKLGKVLDSIIHYEYTKERCKREKLEKAIEILKRFDFDIYASECLGFIQTSLEDPLTFDLEDFIEFQQYELLKEVLEDD